MVLGSCTFCRHQTRMLWTSSWACPVRLYWQDVRTRALDGKQTTSTKYLGSYDIQFFIVNLKTKLSMRGNRKQFCTILIIRISHYKCQNEFLNNYQNYSLKKPLQIINTSLHFKNYLKLWSTSDLLKKLFAYAVHVNPPNRDMFCVRICFMKVDPLISGTPTTSFICPLCPVMGRVTSVQRGRRWMDWQLSRTAMSVCISSSLTRSESLEPSQGLLEPKSELLEPKSYLLLN